MDSACLGVRSTFAKTCREGAESFQGGIAMDCGVEKTAGWYSKKKQLNSICKQKGRPSEVRLERLLQMQEEVL